MALAFVTNIGDTLNPAVLILSSLGGIVAFVGGIIMVIRAIMKNVNATQDNTEALNEIKQTLKAYGSALDQHSIDIAVLKDRQRR